ncbi:hypothetical protein NDU88_009635 [Pleurodeles waltl]|uniref:HTH OST-type domain-containing protein n=1 Tax=Pleurodeles waltl TaxID=8319 RepID=A0AAV7PVT6_PLEWA|nr:hypothetical protein NDU88_009635 [Pleurodeles waltl]
MFSLSRIFSCSWRKLRSFYTWTMDHILASEVLVVVLQAPEGLTFSEFRRLFHSTHGYPLDLARYGYRSLQHLLDDMKDLVVVVEAADQEPQIACRSIHQHTYIFLGENEISPEVGLCSAQAMEKPSASNRPRDVPGLGEISLSSSQCSLSSGVQTPSSDIFLTEKKNTHLEEDCCDQASLDDLHQLNIQCMESAEVSHYVLHHQEGLQEASELLTNSLSTFPTGLKLRKLKEVVKNKHGTDLEELSRSLGCVDVLHLLQHLPNIRILHPLKPANCVVQLQGGLWKTPLSSSQCSFASGVLTPSSDAFLAEEKDTLLKEDCIDQATLDDLQQLNIQCMENEEASHYVVPQHKDSKPSDGCKKSNYEKRGTAPPRSQSASKTSKNTALTSRPLPCNSSATPGSIHPQNSIHIQNTPRQSFRKPSPLTNQTKSKAKSKPARRNATPTKPQATKESLVKYPFKIQKPPLKQTAADQLSKPLVVTHHNHQHQEKSYTPQVSRLRTAALSYSSVVSQNIAEAPANESPLNNPPAPYPTSIHYIDASKTEHSAPNFSPPISDFPHLSEKTKNGSYCSRAMESEHLLASQKNGEELKNNISCVLEAHPKGMSLFQFQHTYRTMFHRMLPLNGYTTVKQMLEEMKEVVRMEDLGVQCWLFPVSSHAVSSQRMDLEFGLQNQPVSEQLGHSIHATMSTVNQLKNKLQNESQHKLVTSKALLDNPARNLSKPGHQDDLKNTCDIGREWAFTFRNGDSALPHRAGVGT